MASHSLSNLFKRLFPPAAGVVAVVLLGLSVRFLDQIETQLHQEEVRASTIRDLSTLRAQVESSLNKRLFLTMGLKAYVSCNPEISHDEFTALAASLQQEGKGIRSLTLIKDNVISDVFPRAGNEKAIGLRLLDHPRQRDAALRAIATGSSWLAGPIPLVQGGEAFIHRAPVFETPPGGKPGTGRYWGMVSILIDKETLLEEILEGVSPNIRLGIRGADALGDRGKFFAGDDSVVARQPVTLNIKLPTGDWQVLAVPKGGWPRQSPNSNAIRLGGTLAALMAGGLVHLLLASIIHAKEARSVADAASRAKSEFLANVSHEIRTPMTAILGFADVLLGEDGLEKAPPHRRKALETIKRNGEHLLRVINDVLDLSKIEAGKFEVERVACNPHKILREVQELMQVRADAKGLDWQVTLDGPLPTRIQSDPTRLRQILINLVGNAIKFTGTGSVKLVARFVRTEQNNLLEIDVVDTGIGMNDEQFQRLFQPFMQADNSMSRRFGGTGLGLTVSKRFAELLGGTIKANSEPGVGSTFTLSIDVGTLENAEMSDTLQCVQPQPIPVAPAESADPVDEPLKERRVLLVEDGPDNQRLISFFLRKAGAEVTLAENGLIGRNLALDAVAQGKPFDVVLTDMQMPVMDGYTATRELRDQGYRGPIIALTAHAMAEERQKCLDAGCDDFATKPINREQLIDIVATWIDKAPVAGHSAD